MSILLQSLAEVDKGDFESFAYEFDYLAALKTIWSPPDEAIPQVSESHSLDTLDDVSFCLPDSTPWSIAFTPTFRKSVESVDKKLQGRVLVALSELSEAPLKSHGDTVKPLIGDLNGLWRYRIGDYRLVYQPRQENRTVVLLEFAARGGGRLRVSDLMVLQNLTFMQQHHWLEFILKLS